MGGSIGDSGASYMRPMEDSYTSSSFSDIARMEDSYTSSSSSFSLSLSDEVDRQITKSANAPLGKTASFFLKAALTVGGGLAGLAGIALLPLAIPGAALGLVGGGITLLAGGARDNEGKQNIGEALVKSGLAGAFPTTGGLLVALVAYQLAYGKPKEEEL